MRVIVVVCSSSSCSDGARSSSGRRSSGQEEEEEEEEEEEWQWRKSCSSECRVLRYDLKYNLPRKIMALPSIIMVYSLSENLT